MKKTLEILAMIAVLIWGGVFLYFYLSGRIDRYLDPKFHIYALVAGIGFLILGLFNLLNIKRKTGACTHDHAHGEDCDHHEHHHHEHDHVHGEDCDHHSHQHSHDHGESCDHHDHDHDHSYHHDHEEEEHGCCGSHEHSHHDESPSSLVFALLVLLAPVLMSAHYAKDSFSMSYVNKWAKIEREMQKMKLASQRDTSPKVSYAAPKGPNPYTSPDSTPEQKSENADSPGKSDTPPEPGEKENAEKSSTDNSWGEFTLEDLKQMVPMSKSGDFQLDVPQIFYTAGDRELMNVMEGIPVETVAQLMESEEEGAKEKNQLMAFRLFIECCAADARPLSIPVEFPDGLPEYKEMGWYTIYATLHYTEDEGIVTAHLKIKDIAPTTEPVEGLLY